MPTISPIKSLSMCICKRFFKMQFQEFMLLVALWGCNVATSINECPPKESTSCLCTQNSGAVLFCENIDSLQTTIDSIKGYQIKKLVLTGVNASSVPDNLYQGQSIKEIVLEKFEVDDASFRPGRSHFAGLENSLEKLEIMNSFKKNRPLLNLKLDHLKHLEIVLLEDNNIPEVGNDWFTNGPETMSTLIFERNGIEELGDRAFSSLRNLKLLAVAKNHLVEISRSMFPSPAHNLRSLDLAFNKIRTLPTDLFTGMISLGDVNIGYNLIHVLPEDTWSPIFGTLQNLDLDGNPLECDNESLKWVCDYKVDVITAKCASPSEKRGLQLRKICNV